MVKDIVTLKDVRLAWDAFNDLPKPQHGMALHFFTAREAAWLSYTKLRDQLLYQLGTLRLPVAESVWHYGDGLKKH